MRNDKITVCGGFRLRVISGILSQLKKDGLITEQRFNLCIRKLHDNNNKAVSSGSSADK